MDNYDIFICGGGPSGLVALKEFTEAGYKALCVEKAGAIGGAFREDSAYENMYLTITNRFMAFSDFPDPTGIKYSSREEYIEYLHKYCAFFDLNKNIRLNTKVTHAKLADGKWSVMLDNMGEMTEVVSDKLIIATGSNHTPKYAPVPGFTGEVIHSQDYSSYKPFAGKKVMVIGRGESAADIAADISSVSPGTTYMWSRTPFATGPRYISEKSADELKNLPGPSEVRNVWEFLETPTTSRMASWLTPAGYNGLRIQLWNRILKVGGGNALHHLGLLCLEMCGEIPNGFERSDQLFAITKSARMHTAIANKTLNLVIAPEAVYEGKKVTFKGMIMKNWDRYDNTQHVAEIDAIVMCTGFKTDFKWLEGVEIDWNPRTWFRHSIPPGYEDKLAFLGWTRPHQGGIPACSEMLARYLSLVWKGERQLPSNWKEMIPVEQMVEEKYWAFATQYKTLVDYPKYMASMAKLIGCEPIRPSIFNLKKWVQFHTFPQWPHFFRSHGPGAKPRLIKELLAPHGMFDAFTPIAHPISTYDTIYMLMKNFAMMPLFAVMHMFSSEKGKNMSKGWTWGKSLAYVGTHGQDY